MALDASRVRPCTSPQENLRRSKIFSENPLSWPQPRKKLVKGMGVENLLGVREKIANEMWK